MNESIDLLIRHGYAVIFGWVLVEQIGLPIPAVPVLLAAGGLAGTGKLNLPFALGAAVVASLFSDTIWYAIGRLRGGQVLSLLCRISLEPDSCVRRTEETFARHGAHSLLVAKFVPGLNTAAPPLAGIIGMRVWRFLVFTGLGGLIWAGAFVGLGYVFSSELERIATYAARLGAWAVATAAGGLAAYILTKDIVRQRFLRQLRIARITPEELKVRLDAGEPLVLVDLRHSIDFETDPAIIPGALRLTPEELEARHHEIPRDGEIVLYCT
jgi:membrane protein DedA with SNARE-associated domain